MKFADTIDALRIRRDWRILCRDIGERRAGTEAEQQAADFIAKRLTEAGCVAVRQEAFPCTSLRSAKVDLKVWNGRTWQPVEGTVLTGAPGTPRGRPIEGELVWIESPEGVHRLAPGSLRGKVAAWFGPLPTSLSHHRRLVAASPAAVLQIDERLPFTWAKHDGVYPYWVTKYGMPPTIAVPYREAWHWRQRGFSRVRLAATVDLRRSRSQNVIGEIPGRDPGLPALVVTAHHDTQAGNPGADDNGSGVMAVLELARVLAGREYARTVRFISFGAEEQLSVGAAAYVRAHRREVLRTTGLVVNFDSVSSPLGHFELSCIGSDGLAREAVRRLAQGGLDVMLRREITPFVDNFPFNRIGVPSLWFMRGNFPGGRWQHHSRHDTLAHVSVDELVRLLSAVTPWIDRLAAAERWTFDGAVPSEQLREARRLGKELFGS